MIVIEISPNANCDTMDMRVFHDLAPAQAVRQIEFTHEAAGPAWYDVTGWTTANTPCPALAQKVDDSGEGTAFLIYGGDAGLRLRPAGSTADWQIGQADQWGEPFFILVDVNLLRFV